MRTTCARLLAAILWTTLAAAATASTAVPLDLLLMMDESGSMEFSDPPSDRARLRVDAAQLVIWLCSQADRVAAVGFGNDARWLTGAAAADSFQPAQEARHELVRALSRTRGRDAHTMISRGMELGLAALEARTPDPNRTTFAILLTDGQQRPIDVRPPATPQTERARALDFARRFRELHVPILTVALGNRADRAFLEEIARESDGSPELAVRAVDLRAIYTQLFSAMAGRFVRHAAGDRPPVSIPVRHKMHELVAVALSPVGFDPDFRFRDPDGAVVLGDESARGRTWTLTRVRNPRVGNWSLEFSPRSNLDLLFLKEYPRFSMRLTSPSSDVAQWTEVPLAARLEADDPQLIADCRLQGTVSDGNRVWWSGPLTAAAVPGDFTAKLAADLLAPGVYRLAVRATLAGDDPFAHDGTRYFRVSPAPRPHVPPPPVPPPPRIELVQPRDSEKLPAETDVLLRARLSGGPAGVLYALSAQVTGPATSFTLPLSALAEGLHGAAAGVLPPGPYRVRLTGGSAGAGPDPAPCDAGFEVLPPPCGPIRILLPGSAGRVLLADDDLEVPCAAEGIERADVVKFTATLTGPDGSVSQPELTPSTDGSAATLRLAPPADGNRARGLHVLDVGVAIQCEGSGDSARTTMALPILFSLEPLRSVLRGGGPSTLALPFVSSYRRLVEVKLVRGTGTASAEGTEPVTFDVRAGSPASVRLDRETTRELELTVEPRSSLGRTAAATFELDLEFSCPEERWTEQRSLTLPGVPVRPGGGGGGWVLALLALAAGLGGFGVHRARQPSFRGWSLEYMDGDTLVRRPLEGSVARGPGAPRLSLVGEGGDEGPGTVAVRGATAGSHGTLEAREWGRLRASEALGSGDRDGTFSTEFGGKTITLKRS